MFDAITLSTGDIDFLKLRTMGDSGALRDKYVEITAHLLLGDAGKLSFNFLSTLDFSILLRKTSELQGRTRACAVLSSRILIFFHGVFSLLINFLASFHQFSVSFLVLVFFFFLLHNFHYTPFPLLIYVICYI